MRSEKRETGFEPATSSLARRRSTTELLPQNHGDPGRLGVVGERRVELLRLAALVPKTSVSAIPPLARVGSPHLNAQDYNIGPRQASSVRMVVAAPGFDRERTVRIERAS